MQNSENWVPLPVQVWQLISLRLTSLTVLVCFGLFPAMSDHSPVVHQASMFFSLFTCFFSYEQWSFWFDLQGLWLVTLVCCSVSLPHLLKMRFSMSTLSTLFSQKCAYRCFIDCWLQLYGSYMGLNFSCSLGFRNIFSGDYLMIFFFHTFLLNLILSLSNTHLNLKKNGVICKRWPDNVHSSSAAVHTW